MALFIKLFTALFIIVSATLVMRSGAAMSLRASTPPVAASPGVQTTTSRTVPNPVATPARPVVPSAVRPAQAPTTQPANTIYRWVDDAGQVHFSDRPGAENAVAHMPKELGVIEVSAAAKRRLAGLERETSRQKKILLRETTVPARRSSAVAQLKQASYRFESAQALQKHKYVELNGRISGEQACRQLEVSAAARSNKGRTARGRQVVSYNGFGSTLFAIRTSSGWNGGDYNRPQWTITSLTATCRD